MPEKTHQRRAGSPRRGRGGNSSAKRGPRTTTKKKPTSNAKPLTPVLDVPDIESFAEFSLSDEIQKAIADMGIVKPTPIQALSIEPVLNGKDVIAKAETGTGKTLAFGAPMMSKIDPGRSTVLGLVLSPTRELAEQVHDVLETLGEARGVKTALVVGGEPTGPQVRKLQAGAQVIVGTPGRVLDLLGQKFLQFPWTEFAILDEADKMLEIGFIDDVKKILDACNEYRQTLLFSATFPPPLLDLARGYTNDPIEIATASGVSTVDTINQYVLRCGEADRAKNLGNMIEDSAPDDVFLTFCERRTDVDKLMRALERRRFSVKALHGGYDQAARFRVMGAFRTGDVKCLVATDVASRGLDVKHVTHVVNLGVPRDVSDYTHRIGRTGRAGRRGVAVTFISGRDERGFKHLLDQSGFDIAEISRPRDLFAQEERAARRLAEDDENAVDEADDAENEAKTAEVEERPRRERKRRPRRGDSASTTDDNESTERAPRRERPSRKSASTESDTSSSEAESKRPRRPRRRRDAEESGRPADDRASSDGRGDDVRGGGDATERPRRARRSSRDEAKSEVRDEPRSSRSEGRDSEGRDSADRNSEERPPRRRHRRNAEERSESAPRADEDQEERPRRKRRPSRDHDEAAERTPVREDAPRSERGRDSSDDERPRRKRRPRRGSENEDAPAESRGKGESKRPKRGSDRDNGRSDTPKKSAPAPRPGGFGQGI